MTDVPDWDYSRVRSRAVDTERTNQGEPSPVIATTESGEHPHGDGTRWGATVHLPFILPAGTPEGIEITSAQITRAQVADHYARRWRWVLEVTLHAISPLSPDVNLNSLFLEWTMGVGQSVMVRRFDLAALAIPLSAAAGWVGTATGTSFSFMVHDVGPLTNPIAEALAARLILGFSNAGEDPFEGEAFITLFIAPEALSSQ